MKKGTKFSEENEVLMVGVSIEHDLKVKTVTYFWCVNFIVKGMCPKC